MGFEPICTAPVQSVARWMTEGFQRYTVGGFAFAFIQTATNSFLVNGVEGHGSAALDTLRFDQIRSPIKRLNLGV